MLLLGTEDHQVSENLKKIKDGDTHLRDGWW